MRRRFRQFSEWWKSPAEPHHPSARWAFHRTCAFVTKRVVVFGLFVLPLAAAAVLAIVAPQTAQGGVTPSAISRVIAAVLGYLAAFGGILLVLYLVFLFMAPYQQKKSLVGAASAVERSANGAAAVDDSPIRFSVVDRPETCRWELLTRDDGRGPIVWAYRHFWVTTSNPTAHIMKIRMDEVVIDEKPLVRQTRVLGHVWSHAPDGTFPPIKMVANEPTEMTCEFEFRPRHLNGTPTVPVSIAGDAFLVDQHGVDHPAGRFTWV